MFSASEPRHASDSSASSAAFLFTLPLHEVGVADVPRVGGKAAHLGTLVQAGLPVPPGFCVTTAAFDAWVCASPEALALRAALGRTNPANVEEMRTLAARLRQASATTPIPPAVEQAIVTAWQALGAQRAYAVRSSATAEDSPTASLAGQQRTFLNMRGRDALLESIRRCWCSLYSDRAIVYRATKGMPHDSACMAILVQELVDAEVSGVLFTRDPVDQRPDRIVIEAAYGLGEGLVSGRVTPDRFVLDKKTLRVLRQHVATKVAEVRPDPAGGVHTQPVEAARAGAPCLTQALLHDLAKLALAVERALGPGQDIEWALIGGRLWILQARPITTRVHRYAADRCIWSNVNSGELLPDVATPMTWSVVSLFLEHLLGTLLRRFGITGTGTRWFDLIAGRVYANVSTFVTILRSLPGVGRMDLSEVFGGHQARLASEELERLLADVDRGGFVRRALSSLRFAKAIPWLLAHLSMRRGVALVARVHRVIAARARVDLTALSDDELAGYVPATIAASLRPSGTDAIAHAAVGLACVGALYRFTRRYLGDAHGAIANRLLSRAGGMDSAAAALELWRLAAWAQQRDPVAAALASHTDFTTVHQQLPASDDGREFLRRWDEWMLRHGHHTRAEIDVHKPRWSETPDYVLDLLRSFLAHPHDLDAEQQQRTAERRRLLVACRRRLAVPQRWLFDYLVRQSQQGLALRENLKSEGIRLIALIRRIVLESGTRLARRGVLSQADDVFFLRLEELEALQRGDHALAARRAGVTVPGPDAGRALTTLIATRRAEYAYHQTLSPPPVIVGRFEPDAAGMPAAPLAAEPASRVLHGLAVSAGVAVGPARVILHADDRQQVLPGEILVAPFADPGWTPYFVSAAGIVLDLGGLLSHGCIVAREYGIPTVVNVGPATQLIRTGQLVQVDGDRGIVTVVSAEQS